MVIVPAVVGIRKKKHKTIATPLALSGQHKHLGMVRLTVPIGNTSIDLPQNLFLIRASAVNQGDEKQCWVWLWAESNVTRTSSTLPEDKVGRLAMTGCYWWMVADLCVYICMCVCVEYMYVCGVGVWSMHECVCAYSVYVCMYECVYIMCVCG